MITCHKCKSQLEEDSKYCTNCGEKLSDSALKKLHQGKTSTKVKIFILKTTAFILAIIITMLVKSMLMVAGLIEVSDDFMKTGLFLFLGLWLLLNGLFLKNNNKKKWGYGLLFFYVIGSVGFGYVINNTSTGLDARILNTMENTPIKLSEDIELSKITIDNNDVYMNYTLLNISESQLNDSAINELKSLADASNACDEKDYMEMMKYGKIITLSYYGNQGELVAETVLSASKCGLTES